MKNGKRIIITLIVICVVWIPYKFLSVNPFMDYDLGALIQDIMVAAASVALSHFIYLLIERKSEVKNSGIFNTGFPTINIVFALVIMIVISNVAFNYYIIRKNKAHIGKMTELINPYIESLEQFNLLVTESKMYTTNWVYLQNNIEDKQHLDSLHKVRFPALKKKLDHFILALHNNQSSETIISDSLVNVFVKFYLLIEVEKKIMKTLVGFDDYENPQKKFAAEDLIESEVLPRTDVIMEELHRIIAQSRQEAIRMKTEIEQDSFRMTAIMLAASFGLLLFVIIALVLISKGIRMPVLKMKEIIKQLGRGELPKEKIETQENVIGEMAHSVNALTESFTQTSEFANEIENGNLNVHYDKLSENDQLGNALINMRNSLRAYSRDMEQQVRERTHEVLEKGRKLEIAYKEIRDSINYAKRIQESILPATESITHVFNSSFIFYKPKDVVCGDFYWFGMRGDEAVIAAIDCTGHGVPGALMTVIGNSLLNQIVTSSGVTSPSVILTQLDKKLHETLKQHGNIVTNDGMDAAVCRYKISRNEITFAGAKRPLYMFKKGELIEIKGNKSPIGSFGHDLNKRFSEHKFNVNSGDTLYMFSDGLQDQFGGEDGKKFMIKRFRDLLSDIQHLSMPEQGKRVEAEITEWQKDYEQTDDMLLIGIRF